MGDNIDDYIRSLIRKTLKTTKSEGYIMSKKLEEINKKLEDENQLLHNTLASHGFCPPISTEAGSVNYFDRRPSFKYKKIFGKLYWEIYCG